MRGCCWRRAGIHPRRRIRVLPGKYDGNAGGGSDAAIGGADGNVHGQYVAGPGNRDDDGDQPIHGRPVPTG